MAIKRKKEKKEPNVYLCPHCKKEINPARMLYEKGLAKQDVSSERMRKVVQARWNRIKLYGF